MRAAPEIEMRYTIRSTDGLLESAKIRCPRDHQHNGALLGLAASSIERLGKARAHNQQLCDPFTRCHLALTTSA